MVKKSVLSLNANNRRRIQRRQSSSSAHSLQAVAKHWPFTLSDILKTAHLSSPKTQNPTSKLTPVKSPTPVRPYFQKPRSTVKKSIKRNAPVFSPSKGTPCRPSSTKKKLKATKSIRARAHLCILHGSIR